MFVREYGLVHNPGDPERYVRLVKWEIRWHPVTDTLEMQRAVPVAWEMTSIDVSNPRAIDYSGPVWRLVPTAITELTMKHWPALKSSEPPTETEDLRRTRIRALRRACHVDEVLGAAEPPWREESVRAAA